MDYADYVVHGTQREGGMIYYVSLSKDLLYCYIEFEADSEELVREYLLEEYYVSAYQTGGTWKLPWCSIYENTIPECDADHAIIIPSRCGYLSHDEWVATPSMADCGD